MAKGTPALALAVWLASLGALHAQDMTKPLGKWERKMGKDHVTLIVEENRLHVTIVGESPCTLHADYGMTKDGIVYGVITSYESDEEDADKSIFDAPFTCRYRIDEGALIIRDLKCREVTGKDELWNGRFKAVHAAANRSAAVAPAPIDGIGQARYVGSTKFPNSSTPESPNPLPNWWFGSIR